MVSNMSTWTKKTNKNLLSRDAHPKEGVKGSMILHSVLHFIVQNKIIPIFLRAKVGPAVGGQFLVVHVCPLGVSGWCKMGKILSMLL